MLYPFANPLLTKIASLNASHRMKKVKPILVDLQTGLSKVLARLTATLNGLGLAGLGCLDQSEWFTIYAVGSMRRLLKRKIQAKGTASRRCHFDCHTLLRSPYVKLVCHPSPSSSLVYGGLEGSVLDQRF